MKTTAIIFLLLVLSSNCKTNETEKANDFSFLYDIVLMQELTDELVDQYILTVDFKYIFSDKVKKSLEFELTNEEKNIVEKILSPSENFSGKIRQENLLKIEQSKSNGKPLVIKYHFSRPVLLARDKVCVLVSTYYMPTNSQVVKGGQERIIFFKKSQNKWEIDKKKVLIEY